ncbi:MAG: murein biosynthesis integral membrane protein MurJ [Candidatus Roizmanbacteria bacterium]|nr:MAG: murein biosynthesis integral membrane protein MurJ [Candidatus Roizmanbacteria bacterium]
MKKIFSQTKQLIISQQKSMFSSTLILASMIVVARIFGFIRYRVLAGYFTAEQLDIYFAAFRLPDLIFEILISGALTASFIPFYIKYQNNKKLQDEYISSIINILTLFLFGLIIVLTIFSYPLISFITPGFDKEKIKQIAFFSQILLFGQLPFLALGNFLTGISQAKRMFLIPAIAPILYNVMIIVMTFIFASSLNLLAPVIGVIFGALLFLLVQLPIISLAQFHYQLIIKKAQELWDFFRMIVPRVFTIIIAQIDVTIDLTLASLAGAGSYTVFYFAQHLQLLPVAVLGIAFGQASLPYLSDMYQQKKFEDLKRVIIDSILSLFFFTIPIASFFIFARTPVIRLFFGGPKFDWDATVLTAVTLSYFSLALPFHAIYYFITRCFYALFDSKTPFYLSFISLLVNITLSVLFILILKLPVWSLAISFSVAMILNVILLMIILYIKLNGYAVKTLIVETLKICFATILSSTFVYYVLKLFDNLIFDTTRTINVFFLICVTGTIYVLLYLLFAWIFNIREFYLISKMIVKVKEYQKKIIEIYSQVS